MPMADRCRSMSDRLDVAVEVDAGVGADLGLGDEDRGV
jgi:hypothetical protein